MVEDTIGDFCNRHDLIWDKLDRQRRAQVYVAIDRQNMRIANPNAPYEVNNSDVSYEYIEKHTGHRMGSLVVKKDIDMIKLKVLMAQEYSKIIVRHKRQLKAWIMAHNKYQRERVVNSI